MTWDTLWTWAQTTLGGTIVGGLVVALVVAVVSAVPKLRQPVFSGIAWAARSVWDSRPARNARNYAKDLDAQKVAVERSRTEGYAKREAELRAERALPRIRPRWGVKRRGTGSPKDHVLINYEPKAVQTNVQLTAPIDKFAIDGNGYWKDGIEHILNKYHCEGHFQGSMKVGAVKGVTFTITYRDEFGDEQTEKAHMDPVPLYARIISPSSSRRIDRGPGRGGTAGFS